MGSDLWYLIRPTVAIKERFGTNYDSNQLAQENPETDFQF